MIKKCKVVLHNKVTIVVDYEGTLVQLPYSAGNFDELFVKKDGSKYVIVSKEDYEKSTLAKVEKKKNKTVETELVKDTVEETENVEK